MEHPPQGMAPVISGGDFLPPAAGFDLGSTTYPWDEAHITTLVFGGSVTGNWNPSADDTYSLGEGTTPLEWKDLYLDGIAYIDTLHVEVLGRVNDNILFTLGTTQDGVLVLNTAGLIADAELSDVIKGTSRHMATAANSLLISNITSDGDIQFLVSDGGDSWGMLTFNADDHSAHFGQNDYGVPVTFYGATSGAYLKWDEANDRLVYTATTPTSAVEEIGIGLTLSTDSTFISGTNITWSAAYTSSVLKIVGTHTGTTGGLHGILIQMIQDQNFTAAAEGIIGIKSYLDMTDSAITEGNFMAGTFISKKSGSGTMATGAILHGIEAWTYVTNSSVVGTMIGGNIGYHADSSGDCSAAGTVWKALQVFADNGSMTNPAQETSGIDIWGMAGTIDNALKIGTSGGVTFTRGLLFVGGGGSVTTGIKFGGTAIGTAANVTMTTAIDIDEVTGLDTAINMLGGIHYHVLTVGTFSSTTAGSGVLVEDGSSGRPVNIYADDNGVGSGGGESLSIMRNRLLLTGSLYQGEQYSMWNVTKYVNSNISGYSAGSISTLEWATALTVNGYAGAVIGRIGGGAVGPVIGAGSFLAGVISFANLGADHTGTGKTAAFVPWVTSTTYNWDVGLLIPDSITDTGIEIGTCATAGIDFTGTFTKGINFANATITVDSGRDNSFWSIGTYGSPVTIAVSDNFLATQINLVNDSEALGAIKKLDALYLNVTTGANQGTYGRLKGLESYIVIGHALLDAHAVYGEVYYNDSVTGITREGLGVGGTVDTTGCSSAPAGLLYGGKFRIKGTLDTGTYKHMALFVVSESDTHSAMVIENLGTATVTNMLWLKNPGTATHAILIADDIFLGMGCDAGGNTARQVILNRSTTHTADTVLSGVLVGPDPRSPALAANSLIISNITEDGDILIAVNDGGSSKGSIHINGDDGVITVLGHIIPHVAGLDLGSNTNGFNYVRVYGGILGEGNDTAIEIGIYVSGTDSLNHAIDLQLHGSSVFGIEGTGNGAGGIQDLQCGFFGVAKVGQQSHIADFTKSGVYGDDDDAIETAINALIAVLESFGLTALS